jgi:hypothetical protein
MRTGTVYTDTVVHLAPERFAAEAPYQVVIVDLEGGSRLTARIDGERVSIGDPLVEVESQDGVPFFRKAGQENAGPEKWGKFSGTRSPIILPELAPPGRANSPTS